jgi:hypothetical protein
MGFQKFQSVEKSQVVSPEGRKAIEQELAKVGKTSAANLTDAEREQVNLDKR